MALVLCRSDFLFPQLKNGAFCYEFLFSFIDFVQSKNFVWIDQVLLELDVENFELEVLFRFFYFTVDFHHLFVLVVLFLVFSHVNLRIHRANALNESKVFLFNAKVLHNLFSAFISRGKRLIGSFSNDKLGWRSCDFRNIFFELVDIR